LEVVLDTLNKYIEDRSARRTLLDSLRHWLAVERRFAALLGLSIIAHLLFYAALIVLNSWAMRQIKPARRQSVEYALITEIAPPQKLPALRAAPESLARADANRLQYDPENANDTDLLSRSPKPSAERGNNGAQSLPQTVEGRARASRATSDNGSANKPPGQSAPPAISSAQINRAAQPDNPFIASAPSIQPAAPPPAPSQRQSAGEAASNSQDAAQAAARRGDSSESNAFGIQPSQGQYMARVRAKVSRVNEANMPRDWIETVLNGKVAATFGLTIKRDGRIESLQLVRSSGYSLLDGRAREAIYIASPFEGFPQNAGDTITLQVTVYYTPSR
jgi:TonB family protein